MEKTSQFSLKIFYGISTKYYILLFLIGILFIFLINTFPIFVEYFTMCTFQYFKEKDKIDEAKHTILYSWLFSLFIIIFFPLSCFILYKNYKEQKERYRYEYYSMIFNKEFLYFTQRNPNEISNKVQNDLYNIEKGLGRKGFLFLNTFAELTMILIFSLILSPKIFLFMIVPMFLILIIYNIIIKNTFKLSEKNSKFLGIQGKFMDDLIDKYKTFLLFGNYNYERTSFNNIIKNNKQINQDNMLKRNSILNAPSLVSHLVQTFLILISFFLINKNNDNNIKHRIIDHSTKFWEFDYVHFDLISSFNMIFAIIMHETIPLINEFSNILECSNNFYRLRSESINMDVQKSFKGNFAIDTTYYERPKELYDFSKFNKIILKNVHYKYEKCREDNEEEKLHSNIKEGKNEEIFEMKNLNMELTINKINYIIGKSGSGKTTILSMMMKLIKPQSGNILFNGEKNEVNIHNIENDDFSKMIGYVPQESLFYDMSVKENIKFFRDNITDERVEEVCKFLKLDFINNLSKGFDSTIGMMGSELSGGQRQLLSIARALVNKPKVLLLDEFTSNLDNLTSFYLEEILNQLKKEMIIIVVTHKMHSVNFDDLQNNNVYIIKQGEIIQNDENMFNNFLKEVKQKNNKINTKNLNSENNSSTSDSEEINFSHNTSVALLNLRTEEKNQIEKDKEFIEDEQFEDYDILNDKNNIFLNFMKKQKFTLLAMMIICLLTACCEVSFIVIFYNILLLFIGKDDLTKNFNIVIILFISLLMLSILDFIFNSLKMYLMEKVSIKMIYQIRKKLFKMLLNLNFYNLSKEIKVKIIEVFSEDIDHLGPIMGYYIVILFDFFLIEIILIITTIKYSWKMSLFFFVAAIFIIPVYFIISIDDGDDEKEDQFYIDNKRRIFSNSIFNIKMIKIYNVKEELIRFLIKKQENYVQIDKRLFISYVIIGCGNLLFYVIYGLEIIFCFFMVKSGYVAYEDVLPSFILIINFFIQASHKIAYLFDLKAAKEKLNKITHLFNYELKNMSMQNKSVSYMDSPYEIENKKIGFEDNSETDKLNYMENESNEIKILPQNYRGKIEFRNVSFSYSSNNKKKVLDNVSFIIESGKKVAFVGFSGSGKSTVIQLLLRFFETEKGEILIDDVNIKNIDLVCLRNMISAVFQDADLFERTIYENIKYGDLKANNQEIDNVSNLACVPQEYLQDEQKNIKELSGGEKQRIAIARCLLKARKIVIFDEATSALDNSTEALINKNIYDYFNKNVEKKTLIVVAHRLNNVVDSDKIFVFKNSRIVESGTHNELINKQGVYKSLWKKESKKNQE